jgi:dolichol-phosphate mannosyltransferase
MNSSRPLISVVIPSYNEQDNVRRVHAETAAVLRSLDAEYEMIFVDDGSSDSTADAVRSLRQSDSAVRLIRFARNFGNQPALIAGLRAAAGAAVITMDCDLQHPPAVIPSLVDAWRKGFPVVQALRMSNQDAGLLRRFASSAFNRMLRAISDVQLQYPAGDFLLLDRQAVDLLLAATRRHAFYRGMVQWLGLPSASVPFDAPARAAGASKFNLAGLFRLSWDVITSLSRKPLRLSLYMGLAVIVFLFAYLAVVLYEWSRGRYVPGYPTLVALISLVGSAILLVLGLMGEYLGRIHDWVRELPPYIIVEDSGAANASRTQPPGLR